MHDCSEIWREIWRTITRLRSWPVLQQSSHESAHLPSHRRQLVQSTTQRCCQHILWCPFLRPRRGRVVVYDHLCRCGVFQGVVDEWLSVERDAMNCCKAPPPTLYSTHRREPTRALNTAAAKRDTRTAMELLNANRKSFFYSESAAKFATGPAVISSQQDDIMFAEKRQAYALLLQQERAG